MEETLFDKLYKGTKETFDALKKPFIQRDLQRKVAAAIDNAANQKLDAQLKLMKNQENIQNYDLNEYLKNVATIDAAQVTVDRLKEHYKELFGVDYSS